MYNVMNFGVAEVILFSLRFLTVLSLSGPAR